MKKKKHYCFCLGNYVEESAIFLFESKEDRQQVEDYCEQLGNKGKFVSDTTIINFCRKNKIKYIFLLDVDYFMNI